MLHLKNTRIFHERKRFARKQSRKNEFVEVICIDYMKNPNIAANNDYYKRQLSLYGFNVYCLSDADSAFYVYTEVKFWMTK